MSATSSTAWISSSEASPISRISKIRVSSITLSKIAKSKLFSSDSILDNIALTVGFFEITPQYSGIVFEKSSVPIARAISMISCLSYAANGRRINVSVTRSITLRLVKVWLDTCPKASPVTSAWMPRFSAILAPARIIIRFKTTPICPFSIFSKISATTGSKSTAKNLTRCEAPNLFHI